MKTKKTGWLCTDIDSNQYGRQIRDVLFEFKTGVNGEIFPIDINEYNIKEVEHIINAYGYTFMKNDNIVKGYENIDTLYGKMANWIIAECIFESENVK